jgi:hypothetical protein
VDEAVRDTLSFNSDHVYSYEEMGFTRQQIVEIYADIFERFGFDKRDDDVGVEKHTVVVSALD